MRENSILVLKDADRVFPIGPATLFVKKTLCFNWAVSSLTANESPWPLDEVIAAFKLPACEPEIPRVDELEPVNTWTEDESVLKAPL